MPTFVLPRILLACTLPLLAFAAMAAPEAAAPTPAKLKEMTRTQLLYQACIRRIPAQQPRLRPAYQRWRAENRAWFEQHEHSAAYQDALAAAQEYAREFFYTSEDASGTFASLCQNLLAPP